MKPLRLILFAAGVIGIVLLARGILAASRGLGSSEHPIPTARVERGNVEIDVFTHGELRAPHSASLLAPPVSGTLQIVSMLSTGTHVKAGDTVVEFDPSEQQYNYRQNESQLRQAEQDILKAKADAAVQAAEDETALLKARFDVRRAELEVQRNELVSTIDAEKNDLALQEAKRKLAQLEQDVQSRVISGEAGVKVLEAKRDAAQVAMKVARQNIDMMTLKAPIDGIVAAKENQDAIGGFGFPGIVLPEYHAGDLVTSGRMLAEVLDVDQMEVQAKVKEADRLNLVPNEAADIQIDARPGRILSAKVKSVAGVVGRSWNNNPSGTFQTTLELDQTTPDLRPGLSAQIKVRGPQLKGVLYLPSQCLFQKDGKQMVYVKSGSGFQPKEVKVMYRSESRIVVEGLKEGTEVAVADPASKDAGNSGMPKGAV